MAIDEFQGEYRFLSNFWPAEVIFDGEVYPTVEHAYQAAKTLLPNERCAIRTASTPYAAKRRGYEVTLREDWEELRLQIMEDLVRQKFTRHPDLAKCLLSTAPDILIEGNRWGDTYWGMDFTLGYGDNHLGRILVKVRDKL